MDPPNYSRLRHQRPLILPHPSTLHNLTQGFEGNLSLKGFLKRTAEKLSLAQRIVTLQVDEIHVKQQLSLRSCKLFGAAENSNKEFQHANAIQAFMIRSLFAQTKKVVSLVPVKQQTGECLKNHFPGVLLPRQRFVNPLVLSDLNCLQPSFSCVQIL